MKKLAYGLLVWLIWTSPVSTAWGSECVVYEPTMEAQLPEPPRVVPPIQVVVGATGESPLAGMTMAAPGPEPVEDESLRRRRVVWAAIRNRDLTAFRKAMPSEPAERLALLRQSFALSSAFGASSLPIVRQVLEWDPGALTSPNIGYPIETLLSNVASNWASFDRQQRKGQSVVNPPTPEDQIELFRLLLSAGADGNGSRSSQSPLAMFARLPASAPTMRVARLMLEHGASIEKDRPSYPGALVEAAVNQNGELVRLMLELRVPSQDALDEAIVKSPIVPTNAALAPLLERGADINADGSKFGVGRFIPAWSAASRVDEVGGRELLRLLIRHKVDPNRSIRGMDSPLMLVMHDHELMQGLLELGANTNYRTHFGDMPLHRAARVPSEVTMEPGDSRPLWVAAPALDPDAKAKSVALLLKHGADPNGLDASGMTPLMLTGSGDTKVIHLLLDRGGQVILNDSALANYRADGAPVGSISWSLLNYKSALAAELVRRTDRIPVEDCGAVFYAAHTGATQALSLLLDKRASSRLESNDLGLTPLIAAAMHGQTASVQILLDRRVARVNETTPFKPGFLPGHGLPLIPTMYGRQTALMLAAYAGHTETVKELLRRGADAKRVDAQLQSAIDYAREGGHEDVVALLQPH